MKQQQPDEPSVDGGQSTSTPEGSPAEERGAAAENAGAAPSGPEHGPIPEGGAIPQSPGIPKSPETPPGEPQIMSRLPRTRPQRRSERRPTAAAAEGQEKRSAKARRATKPATAGSRAGSRARSAGSRGTASGGDPRPAAVAERTAGSGPRAIPKIAIDTAVEGAKLPLRIAGFVTKGTAGLVKRTLRL